MVDQYKYLLLQIYALFLLFFIFYYHITKPNIMFLYYIYNIVYQANYILIVFIILF